MLRFVNISVLLLFVLPQISNTILWTNYELNKAAITEEFCVNKEKPELKCNGQCHLAEQLSEPVTSDTNEPVEVTYLPELPLFYEDEDELLLSTLRSTVQNFKNLHFYSFIAVFKIDHPPCV